MSEIIPFLLNPHSANRYVVIKKLGWGHFSTVWMVKDRKVITTSNPTEDLFNQFLALKVQKSAEHYTEAAMDEVELLDCIAKEGKRCEARLTDEGIKDSNGVLMKANVDHARHVAILHDSFFHSGTNGRHMCMAFHMLGCNLLSVIKAYNYRGIPIPAVKQMIKGVAKGLDFLHRKCQIIHTDLKPENVLLEYPAELKMEFDIDADENTADDGVERDEGAAVNEAISIDELEAAIQNPNISSNERNKLKKKLKKRKQKAKWQKKDETEIPLDKEGFSVGTRRPPIHLDPSALALAKMTLSDIELGRIVKDIPAMSGLVSHGGIGETQLAHKRVLSRLADSTFAARNFTHSESPTFATFSEFYKESIDVTSPSKSDLITHFEMCNNHLSGASGGVAEVTFVARSFVSEEDIADSITDALGGIPWERSETAGSTREWMCRLAVPSNTGRNPPLTMFKLSQKTRKDTGEGYRDALSDLAHLVGSNLSDNSNVEFDQNPDNSPPNTSPPFSVFSVQFSVLSSAIVLGFLESCLPGVMFFTCMRDEGKPQLDPALFGQHADNICRHSLAMRIKADDEDETGGRNASATAILGLDLRMIEPSASQQSNDTHGTAYFNLDGPSMANVSCWWNARQPIHHRVNSFLGLDPKAGATGLPLYSGPADAGLMEGIKLANGGPNDVDKINADMPPSLHSMKQTIARASYQPDLKDPKMIEKARTVVVDLGNACWTHRHFSEDIQTRQYRAPEVLIGNKYDTSADIWSLGCMTFELLTGDLLFDPRAGEEYERDEDHLAMFQELLGKIPKKLVLGGKYSKNLFDRKGNLKHIRTLKFWPIEEVLHEKYHFSREDAEDVANFMLPLLEFDPKERATALACLSSDWLKETPSMRRRKK